MAQYHFIGGDGKTYGPYSQEQMQQFMAENRVNAQTQVSADGGTSQPAGQYPELAGPGGAPIPPGGMPPPAYGQAPMAANPAAAQAAVSGPATFMMVLAILSIVVSLVFVVMNLFFGGVGLAAMDAGAEPEGVQLIMQGVGGVGGNICGIIISILILVGSIKMRKLQSYGLSMTACILSIICCTCCIGIGPGIWGIVVLCKPEVKAAFH